MILVRAEGLAYVDHPDRAVVLNLPRVTEQQSPYVFEGVAFEVWRIIDGKRSLEDLIEELAAMAPDVPRATIEVDTRAFIDDLIGRGLIRTTTQVL